MNNPNKLRSSRMPMQSNAPGKHVMPTSVEAMSEQEAEVLSQLDPAKLSEMAEVLFAFNNYQLGPMPGFYVAFELEPGEKWCVGQLCADRAKPLKLFDKKLYKTANGAKRAAEKMRAADLAALGAQQ